MLKLAKIKGTQPRKDSNISILFLAKVGFLSATLNSYHDLMTDSRSDTNLLSMLITGKGQRMGTQTGNQKRAFILNREHWK